MSSSSGKRICPEAAAAVANRRRIPPEIVEEILRHLPVKSLNRFRCVSTSWQSLISDRRFIRKHLMSGGAARDRLFDKSLSHHESLDTLPLSCLTRPRQKYLFGQVKASSCELVASCDGLLCIFVDYESLYIWNPSMKTYRHIPCSNSEKPACSVGFGYDSTRDDYKVVKRGSGSGETFENEVYSLRNDSWTRVGQLTEESLPCCDSVFLNGAIHWLDFRKGTSPASYLILSFDLSENEYTRVPVPEDHPMLISLSDPHDARLCVLRGMLCIVVSGKESFGLWAKKDYRDEESWTPILETPIDVVLWNSYKLYDFKPLYMYENGEVLVRTVLGGLTGKVELLICKNSEVLVRRITSRHQSVLYWDEFVHVESLISPLRMD